MIIVDTSVWADHLHKGDRAMQLILEAGEVLMHPFVLGEIALGHLKPRNRILSDLASVPMAHVASQIEIMEFIKTNHLFGTGVGFIDVHLLTSARLSGVRLWTRDKRLNLQAKRLGVAYQSSP